MYEKKTRDRRVVNFSFPESDKGLHKFNETCNCIILFTLAVNPKLSAVHVLYYIACIISIAAFISMIRHINLFWIELANNELEEI